MGAAVIEGFVEVGKLGRGILTVLINLLGWLEGKWGTVSTLIVVSECVFNKSVDEIGLLQIYT